MPVTIPVTLTDELAERIKKKGALSSDGLAAIIGEAVCEPHDGTNPEIDPRLRGAVNHLTFKRGKILGDIIEPLDIQWEANQ